METISHLNKTFNKVVYQDEITSNREFEHCSFEICDFSNGQFLSCTFSDCTFKNCNLTMTKFSHSQLDKIVFSGCKLVGVNFSDCNDFLFTPKFEQCILNCCSFVRKNLHGFSLIDSKVKETDFTECDLSNSIFQNTDLSNSVFNRTNLFKADFVTAYNYDIDPEINNIKKAKFSLHGLTGLLNKYDIHIE